MQYRQVSEDWSMQNQKIAYDNRKNEKNDQLAGHFEPPENSCDCHAHVFGPLERYQYCETRSYTPPPASIESYLLLLDDIGIERAVIVQPSVYGTDNRATINAVQHSSERFRAVVVVDDDIPTAALEHLHQLGARGIRFNHLYKNNARLRNLTRIADVLSGLDWHLQVLVDVTRNLELVEQLQALPCRLVFDHMGYPTAGIRNPGFELLLELMKDGQAWTKLSGGYHLTSHSQLPYDDIEPIASALLQANLERCLWATDWPHPQCPISPPLDRDLLTLLAKWAPSNQTCRQVLVDNPANLYGF